MINHPLGNRLLKRHKHLKKWLSRQNISCYRLYYRDLTEYPLILDWIDGDIIIWLYKREPAFSEEVIDVVCHSFSINRDHLFIKYRQQQKGLQTQYNKLDQSHIIRIVKEGGLSFELNMSDYLDIGLFLDHRQTREIVRGLSSGKTVLNLFAYTGSFTCYAISGGAKATTTVDISSKYSQWTQRNLALNGFKESADHRVLTEDCLAFLDKAPKTQLYDLIICDPPTFSNSKKMKSTAFSVKDNYLDLIESCNTILSPGGTLIFSTNSRTFKLDTNRLPSTLSAKEITAQTIPKDFEGSGIHRCWKIDKK